MVLRQRPAEGGVTAECLVRRKVEEDDFLEVRFVVVPNALHVIKHMYTIPVRTQGIR